jgi:hypothetical protein
MINPMLRAFDMAGLRAFHLCPACLPTIAQTGLLYVKCVDELATCKQDGGAWRVSSLNIWDV